jgi:hypothetical protein
MRLLLIFTFCLVSSFSGCYPGGDSDPTYPQSVEGWKYHKTNGIPFIGEFVLKLGESTDNGKIRVKLIDIIKDDALIGTGIPRARLQFTRVSDNKIVCENAIPLGSGSLCDSKLSEFDISGVDMQSINTKDRWAYFALTGFNK